MDMDALLMQELGKFIQCSHHALYFPTTHAPRQPELLPRERRLLLPLYRQGSLLGVLMLHGVKVRDARLLLPQLPAIADLCLELLARVKATRVDAVTGLATENVLYGSMEDEAARVREIFADPSRGDGQSSPLHRLCMGLVLLHSIRKVLFALPEETAVLPGHGPATSIGNERRNNPFCGDFV